MANPKFNSKSPTIKRILREAQELASSPSPDFHAAPASDSDIFDWHFTLRGPPSSPFSNGIYHGRIVLPATYPLRPPSFRFLTPSGRFEVNREICLSISGHHEETWMPAWGVRTALVALRSFMETSVDGQLGGISTSDKERESIAGKTPEWRCAVCARSNGEIMKEAEEAAKAEGNVEEAAIPKELNMAYKDEMGPRKKTQLQEKEESETHRSSLENYDSEDVELAEGFVHTGLDGASDSDHKDTVPAPTPTQNISTYPAARPAQTIPQPTGASIPNAPRAAVANAYPTQPLVQRNMNDGVPAWVDRAIVGVGFCLAALFLKILFGF